jgi:hypothetical protein
VAAFQYCKAAEIAKPVYERLINDLVDRISVCGDDNNKNNHGENATIEFEESEQCKRQMIIT